MFKNQQDSVFSALWKSDAPPKNLRIRGKP